jgi:hypothetical protein
MRINGFEQIKSFYSWVFTNPDKVRPVHISLYVFLINQNNRNNWVEWFKCPFDLAMQGACIGSKSTYYTALKELQEWNLLDYKEGVNNSKSPLIRLIVLSKSEPQTIPQSEPQTEPLTGLLTEPQTGKIYKLITDNLKLVTENLERWIKEETKKAKSEPLILPHKSEQFKSLWEMLIKTKKWKSKADSALLLSLKKLSRHPEPVAIKMMEDCIAGEWQGLVEPTSNGFKQPIIQQTKTYKNLD